jgi:hypothetical protein
MSALNRTEAKACIVCDGELVRTRAHGGSAIERTLLRARARVSKKWVSALEPT